MRKLFTILLCIGILISWQAMNNNLASADDDRKKNRGKAFRCKLAGTWRSGNSFTTIVPLDFLGRKYALISADPQPEDATVFGFFEDPTAITPLRGTLERVSHDEFKLSAGQVVMRDNVKLGEVEAVGFTKFVDCDIRVSRFTVKLLDAEGDEIICAPIAGVAERYKMSTPCGELPDYPIVDE
jgi:hypothetical protein